MGYILIDESGDRVRHIAAILDEVLETYEETEFDCRWADNYRKQHELADDSSAVCIESFRNSNRRERIL